MTSALVFSFLGILANAWCHDVKYALGTIYINIFVHGRDQHNTVRHGLFFDRRWWDLTLYHSRILALTEKLPKSGKFRATFANYVVKKFIGLIPFICSAATEHNLKKCLFCASVVISYTWIKNQRTQSCKFQDITALHSKEASYPCCLLVALYGCPVS